ncbi:multidrug efflux SMR transporter [Jiella sp. MQZ9-1]|uniref:Multidrug efflux SMR transporter n=1 Tax=Jiella flava TaxID=2816857 RepID=A0A939JRF6_9HYPH|nr:multidrug efflux SMR transporter [Jiella flava]MBO0661863.1 multidrug efflux SMR transporter [Jiella flava]MCD2470503.1 multidrug efflux SMR transporter [Jiella flava]
MNALYLAIAIVCEILGTSALKSAAGFTRLAPSLMTVAFYAFAFYFLSLPLRTMPVGIVYAIWSGCGVVLLALIDVFWFKLEIDAAGYAGLALIVAGVLVINLFSSTVGH